MTDENGKLLNIVTDIQLDVRETRSDVKKLVKTVAYHDACIKTTKKSVGWLYRILAGVIVGVAVVLLTT
jgi:hypothetical protein